MSWYFKDEATSCSNAVRAALASGRAALPTVWPLHVANVMFMGERRKRSTQAQATKWLRFLAAMQTPAQVHFALAIPIPLANFSYTTL